MTPTFPVRYRVDCQRDRDNWHAVQYEAFDAFGEALERAWRQWDTGFWDTVRVVACHRLCESGRRVLATGGWLRHRTDMVADDDLPFFSGS